MPSVAQQMARLLALPVFFIRRARLLQGRELLLEIVDLCSVASMCFPKLAVLVGSFDSFGTPFVTATDQF